VKDLNSSAKFFKRIRSISLKSTHLQSYQLYYAKLSGSNNHRNLSDSRMRSKAGVGNLAFLRPNCENVDVFRSGLAAKILFGLFSKI